MVSIGNVLSLPEYVDKISDDLNPIDPYYDLTNCRTLESTRPSIYVLVSEKKLLSKCVTHFDFDLVDHCT